MKTNFLYCIVAPSGSGKDRVIDALCKQYELTKVLSYTTRKPRMNEKNTHMFVSQEEFNNIKNKLIAYDNYQGNDYGATEEQANDSNIYIINVNGIKWFKQNYHGDIKIKIIYLDVPTEERKLRMIKRGDAMEDINKRIETDKKEFKEAKEFADIIIPNKYFFSCVDDIHEYMNKCEKKKEVIKINKIKIALDYDGILFDSMRTYLDLFNEYTGEKYTLNDITDWDIHKVLPTKYSKLIDNLWFDSELWNRVQPLSDSQQFVKRLIDNQNVEVFVVTDTHPKLVNIKTELLNKEYPFIDTRNNLFICKQKQMLNIDLLFDDKVDNLLGGKYHKALMSYPCNKSFNCQKNGIVRVNDWNEFYNEVMRILDANKAIWELSN